MSGRMRKTRPDIQVTDNSAGVVSAGAPEPPRRPLKIPRLTGLLEARQMTSDPLGVLWRHTMRHGDTFRYSFGGAKTMIITSRPAIIQHVLKGNHRNYHKSDIQTERMLEFLGPGLLTDRHKEWLPKRQLIQRGFHVNRLDDLARNSHATLLEMLPAFRQRIAEGEVSLSQEMMRFTFAMVARALFGAQMPTDQVERISQAILSVQEMMVRQIVQPYLIPWWRVTGEVRRHQALRQAGDHILMQHILERRDDPSSDGDLLSILLQAANGPHPMTTAQVLAECMQLLVAGHETSSNILSWLLYLLARNPEYIEKSIQEFDAVLGDRMPLHTDLPRLPFNRSIIEETMRLFPPFWMIDRVALESDAADGLKIQAGEALICFVYGVQNSEIHWDDPEIFRPERFDDGLWQHREYLHLPFGAGPRGCIGSSYATIQILILLRAFLKEFTYSLTFDGPPGREARVILRPQNGIPAQVTIK